MLKISLLFALLVFNGCHGNLSRKRYARPSENFLAAEEMHGNFASCSLQCGRSDVTHGVLPPNTQLNRIVRGKQGPRGLKGEPGDNGRAYEELSAKVEKLAAAMEVLKEENGNIKGGFCCRGTPAVV